MLYLQFGMSDHSVVRKVIVWVEVIRNGIFTQCFSDSRSQLEGP